MKLKLIPVLTVGALVVGLGSCKDTCSKERIYEASVPVYLSFDELRQPVTVTASQTLENPGKFWRKDNYLFVSDIHKGIHVYNIANVASPYEMAFVSVPGVVDVAVKDNYLLADSYTDLLVLDISNPGQPAQAKRLNDVFTYNAFKVQPKEGYPVVTPDQTKGVVVGWNIEKVKDEYGCNGGPSVFYEDAAFGGPGGIMSAATGGGPAVFSGGGSMAAFAVKGDYLYSVDNSSLRAYSISDPMNPSLTSTQAIGWNIETIVAYERYLFIGTRSGLQIFGIQNAASPNYISGFTHATACDPVIVQDDIAYVTLRGGTPCQSFNNQLDVLNVQQINNPTLIRTYPMTGPHGLGIDGDILAICEAEHGVKIFNAADPNNVQAIGSIPSLNVTDVIMHNGVALFIGTTGIWVYTYDTNGNFQAGGSISIAG